MTPFEKPAGHAHVRQIAESFSQEQNGNSLPPCLLPKSHTHCILHLLLP